MKKLGPLILKDVSFSLKGGQKTGIVGRTRSGKTLSIQTSLRMINNSTRCIILDDANLALKICSEVREHVITLTQDPFLFPASIRFNSDPLGSLIRREDVHARLAQSVERETLNLKVAGSTPASGSIPDASV
ncbi:hypothetical protein F5Y19DRAFT_479437 [Xylariaceae sp. FL1651]|nr:hypothetical protein F5Y19DRAFT_479437 [Xylariaceae sp. FL1651]